MAPKKKGGKKQADDWENDLGETPDPIAAVTEQAKVAEAGHDDGQHAGADSEELGGGGLLAALKKNKAKRAKKGKPIEDFVEGEDPTALEPAPAEVDLAAKAPEEATLDDEDVFAGPSKKGKGGKKQPEKPVSVDADSDREDGGGLKSKKEKEKEKKEREKQRKKEQARFQSRCLHSINANSFHAGEEEGRCSSSYCS
jgi:translation initiation factor 5B